jgi:hypothetical protein
MPFFVLGLLALLVVMGALGAFSRAEVKTIKQFGVWFVAIGGLLLAVLLLFTRPAAGFATLLGPLLWSWVGQARHGAPRRQAGSRQAPRTSGTMSRAEAYEVLGLKPGASEAEVQAAHHRLMRAAHPDAGGSDWVASRVNQARDILLS